MKKVYILLMHTNTLPSKFIKLFTRYSYTHVGISLDEDCNTIYSFGRKTLYSFLNGGFVIEGKTGAFFEKFHKTKCRIYEVNVSEKEYCTLKSILADMERNMELYKYDYLGMFLRYFKIPFCQEYRYVCSYFVADVLQKSNIIKFNKESFFVEPRDFVNLKELNLVYEGLYVECGQKEFDFCA